MEWEKILANHIEKWLFFKLTWGTPTTQEFKKKKLITQFENALKGFRGGSLVKNSPANAGDTGQIPDAEKLSRVPRLLSLCPRAQGPATEARVP